VSTPDRQLLQDAVEELAAIARPSASPGEREAARWLCARFEALGVPARIEEERAWASYARPLAGMGAVGMLAGAAALRGRRGLGAAGGLAMAASIAADVSNGPRPFRRLTMRRQSAWNVVAELGDPAALRTLVVLAHHDAPQTGLVFHQGPQRRVWELAPGLVERTNTSLPLWWPVIAGPLLVAGGALTRSRRLTRLGTALSATSLAAFADIARSRSVPGANDNASGVAGLLGIAESLHRDPVQGLRVVLVSCGAEEVLQGGIHGFAARHFPSLSPQHTHFVNLDTVGSPHLALLEGEGPVVMEDFQAPFKDLVVSVADDTGISLRRGLRSRNSTDSVIPHRAGYPVATLVSVNAWKALSNYHWPTDVPDNVDYATVVDAVRLVDAVARRLAHAAPA